MEEMFFYSVNADGTLEFLHTETKTTSTQWRLKYADIGTMEFNTDVYSDLIPYILPQAHSDIIAVQGNKSAWIHAETDITGDELNFMINGKTLNFMLNWRIVQPYTVTDTVENIIRSLITDKFMTAGNNYISNFELANAIGGTSSTTYTIEDKPKPLFEVVQELCAIDNLGFSIDIEDEKFVFRLFRGLDKTQDQTDRPAVILSEDEKTLSKSEYVFIQDRYYSSGYYALTVDEVTTWEEIVKDNLTGFYRRECILSDTEEVKATETLKEMTKTEEISGKAEIVYGVDYALGDIVTVQRKIGNTLIIKNKRIAGVDIVIEPNNNSEIPVLEEV